MFSLVNLLTGELNKLQRKYFYNRTEPTLSVASLSMIIRWVKSLVHEDVMQKFALNLDC